MVKHTVVNNNGTRDRPITHCNHEKCLSCKVVMLPGSIFHKYCQQLQQLPLKRLRSAPGQIFSRRNGRHPEQKSAPTYIAGREFDFVED